MTHDKTPEESNKKLSWIGVLSKSIKTELFRWVALTIVGFLGVFSGQITNAIKAGLNRADLRVSFQEEIAKELSEFVFNCELLVEYAELGTTKEKMTEIVEERFNQSIQTLRKNEFLHRWRLQSHWNNSTVEKYDAVFELILDLDKRIHKFNPELKVLYVDSDVTDPEKENAQKILTEKAKDLSGIFSEFRTATRQFLVSLS